MKKRIFSTLFALLLVCSLGLIMTPVSADGPLLDVDITTPMEDEELHVCENFNVTAEIFNDSGVHATGVTASLSIEGNADFAEGDSADKALGDISPGLTLEANWTLHCTGQGPVTITVSTSSTSGHEGSADRHVYQLELEQLTVTIDDPVETEICVCNDFGVSATVTNTGDFDISGVDVTLDGVGEVSVTSTNPVVIGDLARGASELVEWTLHCDGAIADECPNDSWVDVVATAYGIGGNTGEPVWGEDTYYDYVNQRYILVDITTPTHCTDYCIDDEFPVDATVKNCFDQQVTGTVSITLSPTNGAHLVTPPAAIQDLTIDPGATVDIPFAWHVNCDEPGDLTITVKYLGIAGTYTLCDEDTVVVHQKEGAALEVTTNTSCDCVAECNTFTVTATITNPGGATVEDVEATITATGDVSTVDPLTKDVGDINPGDIGYATWVFHCDGPDDASFQVYVEGEDEVCDCLLEATSNWAYTTQVDLDVVITDPSGCAEFYTCEVFCVTAELTNNEETPIEVSNATIDISDTASLVEGESISKGVGTIPAGETQEVSWTVHCDSPGDATFTVTAYVIDPCDLAIQSCPLTVSQRAPPLTLDILSPWPGEDKLTTAIATSEEFAVTVEVTNVGPTNAVNIPVTIDPGDNAELLEPEATQYVDIPFGESKIITWTLHCTGSGETWITVTAVGYDIYTEGVVVTQFPTAHLEVEITEYPDDPITVCDDFLVTATITNTGEADAWEVYANLEVFPEGSVRVSANDPDPDGGSYTKFIGTIPGHGSPDNSAEVTWLLHCKEACESAIKITAFGNDEYGLAGTQRIDLVDGYYDFEGFVEGWIDSTPGIITIGGTVDGTMSGTGHIDGTVAGEIEGEGTIDGSVEGEIDGEGHIEGSVFGEMAGSGTIDATVEGTLEGTGTIEGSVEGTLEGTGTIEGSVEGALEGSGTIDGSVSGTLDGSGTIDGSVSGTVSGSVDCTLSGHITGTMSGTFAGMIGTDPFDGFYDGAIDADIDGTFTGTIDATFDGTLTGTVTFSGTVTGTFSGTATFSGTVTGTFNGTATFSGTVTGTFSGTATFSGTVTGTFSGTATFTGVISGSFSGDAEFTGSIAGEFHGEAHFIGTIEGEFHGDATFSGTISATFYGEATISGEVMAYMVGYLYIDGITYSIIMTVNPGAPILEGFIEPDQVTVKQLPSPTDADLALNKTVDATEPVAVGTVVTFTVTVENLGPADATSIMAYDMLPEGLNFEDSAVSQGWYYYVEGLWSVGDLAEGENATLTLYAKVMVEGEFYNTGVIGSLDQHDPITTNNVDWVLVTGLPPEPITTVDLVEGYNLMSLPLIPEEPDIETMLTGLDVDAVTHYTGGPAGTWLAYFGPGNPANSLDEMNDGLGYWMNMDAAGVLIFDGWELVAETDPPSVPPSYDVVVGWNLTGFKSTQPKLAEDYLAGIAGKYVIIYGYDDGFFIVGTPGHEYLEPGLGYWIAVIESGTIYP